MIISAHSATLHGEATTSDWQRHSDPADPVTVWVLQSEALTYLLVRADIVITAPIGPLLSLLQDASVQHHWLPFTHEVRVLERPAQHQTRVHFLTQSRWPFQPRDAVTLFQVIEESPVQLRINMINQPQLLPPEPGYRRIQQAQGYWLLTALEDCQTRVRYQSGSQWGGLIPQWLVDRSNRQLAETALLNLKRWAESHYTRYTTDASLHLLTAHHTCR